MTEQQLNAKYNHLMQTKWRFIIDKRHSKCKYLKSIYILSLPVPEFLKKPKGIDFTGLPDDELDSLIHEFRMEYLRNSDLIII